MMNETRLNEIAKEYGCELVKELKNRLGYVYEYSFKKNGQKIYAGYIGNNDRYFLDESEIVAKIAEV